MASRRSFTEPRIKTRQQNTQPTNIDETALNNWYETLSRQAKKNNPERAREASFTRNQSAKVHTPHTYPRANNGPPSQRRALQELRQQLVFSDADEGSEVEPVRDTQQQQQIEVVSSAASDAQSSDSGVVENGQTPDSNQIVGRLMQIRDYMKQATDMRDTLTKDSPNSQEQLAKLSRLVSHLREQEEGYMALLQKMLADRNQGSELLNNGQPSHDDDADECSDVSLEVEDVRSDVSECTTDRTWNARNRPNIESHMGVYSDMSSLPSSARGSGGSEATPAAQEEPIMNNLSASEASFSHTLTNQQLVHNVLSNEESETPDNLANQSNEDDVDMLTQSDVSELVQDKEAEVKALRQQRDLLKKMLEQQRMLKALHEKQATLLKIQRDAEANANSSADQERPSSAVQQSDEENPDNEEESAVNDSEDTVSEYDERANVPPDLLALRQRLEYLNNVFDTSMNAQAEDVQKLEVLRQMAAAQNSAQSTGALPAIGDDNLSECSVPERQQLKNKLAELQEKKAQMDRLLNEVHMIRGVRKEQAGGESSGTESTLTGQVLRDKQERSEAAGATAGQAETVLDVMEQESKLRKLNEVRQKLDELRGLVQYYQAGQEFIQNNGEETDEASEGQDMSLYGNISKVSLGKLLQEKSITSTEQSDTSDIDSSLCLGETVNDPEIQEKMRKLQEAKDKLARLQSLVEMVHQQPGITILPDDLAELTSGVDNSDTQSQSSLASSSRERFVKRWDNLNRQEREETGSQTESQTEQDDPEAMYMIRMEEQKEELEKLKEERERLVLIQQELMNLHKQYPQAAVFLKTEQEKADQKKMNGDLSARGVKFVPDVKDPPSDTDALWQRMRSQRMQREESKQGWPEEDQLTADVTTMATWGESQQDSSSSPTSSSDEEETIPIQQRDEEEDDGYPSDGILQVEEEEEGKNSDANTYTVENEYRQRQRYPVDLRKRRVRASTQKNRATSSNPAGGDQWLPGNQIYNHGWPKLTGNRISAADKNMIIGMKEQLDATTEMCQYLLHQQKVLTSRLEDQRSSSAEGEPWQQHRLLYSINQLYSQVADLQAAMKVTVEQVYAISHHLDEESPAGPLTAQDFRPSISQQRSNSSFGLSGRSSGSQQRRDNRQHEDDTEAYLRYLAEVDGKDYFKYMSEIRRASESSRDDQLEAVQSVKQRRKQDLVESLAMRRDSEMSAELAASLLNDNNYSVPPLDLDKLIRRRQAQKNALANNSTSARSYPSPTLSAIAAGRVQLPDYKPGVSAGICGTTFADTASMSSALSSVRSDHMTPVTTPSKSTPGKNSSSSRTEKPVEKSGPGGAAGVEADSGSEFSLFEALRETIYSEVATLISQNENRPHFLIELFRELQMLGSDYLRQRALYSVQELVTKFLTEDVAALTSDLQSEDNESVGAPQPAWMIYAASDSNQTPSESCVTTDEEEVKAMLEQQHTITPSASSAKMSSLLRSGSLQGQVVDYLEAVETTSTLSTSPSVGGVWESPFNNDSLGDTVIHLDKARGTCWFDRLPDGELVYPAEQLTGSSSEEKKALSVAGSDTAVSEVSMPFACNSPLQDTAIDLREAMQKVRDYERRAGRDDGSATSSSAQDQGGSDDEGSADIQMTRIDTQELDRQIKSIMTEIIPALREHMDNICSAQLLSYLQGRVLELTIQPEQQTQEFAHYFHRQLGNILKDSLAKFEGRKMRDCGEEILVDISETLFNELAFFRLMQDLDDPEVKGRLAHNKWRNGQDETSTETSAANESQDDEPDEAEDESESKQEEVEDLGKDRDDLFAQETDVYYELAPSETKPMTRIGSDEDCSDDDSSSSVSTDTADDTAVSRQAAQEGDQQGQEVVQGEDGDLTIDDLPLQLDVNKAEIEAQAVREQAGVSLASVCVSVEDELVGNASELKEPEGMYQAEHIEESEEKDGTQEKEIDTAEVAPPVQQSQESPSKESSV